MDAEPEGDMPVREAVDHELIGGGERPLVVARRQFTDQHAVAAREPTPRELDVVRDRAGVGARRRIYAQELFRRVLEQIWLLDESAAVVEMPREVHERGRRHRRGGIDPTTDDEEHERFRIPLRDRDPVDERVRDVAEPVGARRSAPICELRRDPRAHPGEVGPDGRCLGRSLRVRSAGVEGPRHPGPVVLGKSEKLEDHRGRYRAHDRGRELAGARFDDLIDVVRDPMLDARLQSPHRWARVSRSGSGATGTSRAGRAPLGTTG